MAVVRVLTATGFSSDDLFGPVETTPQAIGSGGGVLIGQFAAFGRAGIRELKYNGSPPITDHNAYTGGVTRIVATDFANDLAVVVFSAPINVSWESTDGWFFNHELFRGIDPTVPARQFAGDDDMQGNAGNDVFYGYAGADLLRGFGGNDRLIGGAGDDRIEGGAGDDDMIGGAGNDTFVFNAADPSLSERVFGSEGNRVLAPGEINTILISGAYAFTFYNFAQIQKVGFETGGSSAAFNAGSLYPGYLSPSLILDGANGNQTVHIDRDSPGTTNLSQFTFVNWDANDVLRLVGSQFNDVLIGSSRPDLVVGNDLDDILVGGAGGDVLNGGAGNDTYDLGADLSDSLVDASGTDTVNSTVTRSLGTWVFIENLILAGSAVINGTGNAAFNSIVGNGVTNILAGQAGNDVLAGGGGDDQLYGQADKDSLTGGAGDDTFGFQSVAHTAAGLGDVVVDFDDNGEDVIDLSGIAGLSYRGMNAFTAPNQVRIQQVGANILVEINTVGNSVAEGEITILNATIGLGVGQVDGGDFLI